VPWHDKVLMILVELYGAQHSTLCDNKSAAGF